MAVVTLRSRIPQIIAELEKDAELTARLTAEGVKQGAQRRAPRDTGEMANSIHVTDAGDAEFYVESPAYYSHMVEFGTRRLAARPFMIPSAEAAGPQLIATMWNRLRGL